MRPTERALEARTVIRNLAIGGFVAYAVGFVLAADGLTSDEESESQILFGLAVLGLGSLAMFVGLVGAGTMLGIRAMETPPLEPSAPSSTTSAGGPKRGVARRPDPGPMPEWAVKDADG